MLLKLNSYTKPPRENVLQRGFSLFFRFGMFGMFPAPRAIFFYLKLFLIGLFIFARVVIRPFAFGTSELYKIFAEF